MLRYALPWRSPRRSTLLTLLSVVALVFSTALAVAQEAGSRGMLMEGADYETTAAELPRLTEGDSEVVELFWYGCPHCKRIEPVLEQWLENKPDAIGFTRLPAVFSARWEPLARAYFAAQELGVLDRTHNALFEAIHDDGRSLNSADRLADFFSEQGVDRGAFESVYNGFSVDSQVRKAAWYSRQSGIRGVPALVINGAYRTSGRLAGGYEAMFQVAETLAQSASVDSASNDTP